MWTTLFYGLTAQQQLLLPGSEPLHKGRGPMRQKLWVQHLRDCRPLLSFSPACKWWRLAGVAALCGLTAQQQLLLPGSEPLHKG